MIREERSPDGSVTAVADVVVGVETRQVRVPLGRWVGDVEAGGLRDRPVVVACRDDVGSLIRAGAEASGRATVSRSRAAGHAPAVGAALLEASITADVIVVTADEDASADVLVTARALGGRPLPVVDFDDMGTASAMMSGCWIDLDIAVPSLDGSSRDDVRRVAQELGLFAAHHVVEVDPRPAFALGPSEIAGASMHELAAAATGVLAGRIAAAGRRWR